MNTTYLLILFIVVITCMVAWIIADKAPLHSGTEALCTIGGIILAFVSAGMLIHSFAGSGGTPIVIETAVFSVERTPYRLIVKAFDRETMFTDSYSVANAERIDKVQLTTQCNAWGITHEAAGGSGSPKVTLLFKDAK